MSSFDAVAADWDKNKMRTERSQAIADKLWPFLGEKKYRKGLEFGAGTGLLSFSLREKFDEIVMMDNSQEMVNMANSKIPDDEKSGMKAVFFDLEKADYPENDFDAVFSQMVMHHVPDTKLILSKFYKLLHPGGLLAIADLYAEDGSFHGEGFDGHLGFEPDLIIQELMNAGFEDISEETCFVINKEVQPGVTRDFPVFLIVARKAH